jgi:23S rRNA (guanosine2251-2'-O)-methyltransferase
MRKFKKPDPRHRGGRDNGGRRPDPRPHAPQIPKGRVAVGIHAVREMLKVRPDSVTALWLKDGYENHGDLKELAAMAPMKPTLQSPATLDRLTSHHQGVAAFSNQDPELNFADLRRRSHGMLIVLDEVEDPHNLGAVLRTAWLMGAQGVLTPAMRSAPMTATVSKVAQGAAEHVPLMQESGLLETLKQLKEDHGFWLFGLSHEGQAPLYQTEIPEKVIWILGSESSGIRKPIERECDQLIAIPQSDPQASLNVSVAAAIAMAETVRQRGATT